MEVGDFRSNYFSVTALLKTEKNTGGKFYLILILLICYKLKLNFISVLI